MPPFIDLTGQQFGRWTVLERAENLNGRTRWRCRCDCGQEVDVSATSLRHHKSNSCGCLQRELASAKQRLRRTRHGRSRTPEYGAWSNARRRCSSPRDRLYPDYGGRGITVDPRWDTFEQFFSDMGPRPGREFSLDRINNDGPYSPENCRWATSEQQHPNRRPMVRNRTVVDLRARIAELEAENARLLSLLPHDAQEAA